MISEVTGISIDKHPSVALLNVLPEANMHPMKSFIHFMLLAAKMTMAGSWKTPTASIGCMKHKMA